MSKTTIRIACAVVVSGIAALLIMQHQEQTRLRLENAALRQTAEQAERLATKNARLAHIAAQAIKAPKADDKQKTREILRLRGQVGRLQNENASMIASAKNSTNSGIGSITTDPELKKALRDQQKMGMAMMYKDFAKGQNLSKEQTEKLHDILADNVMDNIDIITSVLRDGNSPEEQERLFAHVDAGLRQKVSELLGVDTVSKYDEYSRNLASHLSADQFKMFLTGDQADKDNKVRKLYELMQAQTQAALANAGLDPNFQTLPILNFRNIASESEAEKNLKLLEGIYAGVAAKTQAFLDPDEVEQFHKFQITALKNSRMALAMNRKLMGPAK
jgi:hypothetical protein